MQQYNEIRWCSKYLIFKIFFVSVLLQYCLSFVSIEEENPAIESSFYQNLDNGIWNILMKVPRGYMVPMPRVGRRHIHEVKRQNMIPQPRIGRQLDIDEELAKIFSDIQYFVTKSNLIPGQSMNKMEEKLPSGLFRNLVTNEGNTANENAEIHEKESTFSTNGKHVISHLVEGETTNTGHENDDNKISISYFPNKDERYLPAKALISGVQLYDDEKSLIPLSRQGRETILSAFDENLDRDLLAYHRPCCRLWEKIKTAIPDPRAGRLAIDPGDYDNFLNVVALPESEDSFLGYEIRKPPPPQKIKRPKFIPRLGRKKRSISTEPNENDHHNEDDKKEFALSTNGNSVFDGSEESEADYLFTLDKGGALNENAFASEIGKKRSNYLDEYFEEKRAAAFTPRIGRGAMFTPRIGRALLIPRIGRTDPRSRLRSRSSFIPRIGRRAALIPRVGRSENS